MPSSWAKAVAVNVLRSGTRAFQPNRPGFAAVPPPWAFNMLAYDLEPNGPWTQYSLNDHNNPTSTYLLRALMLNESFRRDFINRFADLLNTNR